MFGEMAQQQAAEDPVQSADEAGVELAAAIEALRSALIRAAYDGVTQRVRFRLEPVELTVHVGVTRTGKGSAGIKWHLLSLGGERSKENATTQTLTLRLTPVLHDDHDRPLPESEQLISDADDEPGPADGSSTAFTGEPE